MAKNEWKSKNVRVASLQLDAKNPRLGRESRNKAPREIVQYLFDHDDALEIVESIVKRGFFPNEPLLVILEKEQHVVVEGNRRLAALKAILQPGLLDDSTRRKVERLIGLLPNVDFLKTVPCIVAPSRKATDKLVSGRHIGTPVLAWQAENRASFILDKLAEGYTNETLAEQLGFSDADIQEARQTRAIADMARSLDLSPELLAKLNAPRTSVFSTLGRLFDSTLGRKYLRVVPDPEHGLRGTTSRDEFLKGFKKVVEDVVLGNVTSRTINSSADIEKYFNGWKASERPKASRSSFVPAEVIAGKSVASSPVAREESPLPAARPVSRRVIPSSFKVRYGSERLKDIRKELVGLDREKNPNAGAVLLRVFLELAAIHYLQRSGAFDGVVAELRQIRKLRGDIPTLGQLLKPLRDVVKRQFKGGQRERILKALSDERDSMFCVGELHSFVHNPEDFPTPRDIQQFWTRTEPLFRLMLEQPLAAVQP